MALYLRAHRPVQSRNCGTQHRAKQGCGFGFPRLCYGKGDLSQIEWFHTDRGSEFKNETMDELLLTFEIGRSLSKKACPYDNAVAEATYKVLKTLKLEMVIEQA